MPHPTLRIVLALGLPLGLLSACDGASASDAGLADSGGRRDGSVASDAGSRADAGIDDAGADAGREDSGSPASDAGFVPATPETVSCVFPLELASVPHPDGPEDVAVMVCGVGDATCEVSTDFSGASRFECPAAGMFEFIFWSFAAPRGHEVHPVMWSIDSATEGDLDPGSGRLLQVPDGVEVTVSGAHAFDGRTYTLSFRFDGGLVAIRSLGVVDP